MNRNRSPPVVIRRSSKVAPIGFKSNKKSKSFFDKFRRYVSGERDSFSSITTYSDQSTATTDTDFINHYNSSKDYSKETQSLSI